jgi:hypothetical protein
MDKGSEKIDVTALLWLAKVVQQQPITEKEPLQWIL